MAEAVVRIDVEFTLTCAAPMIRARTVVFDKIAVRTDATAAVKRAGVGVWHTVIGARLVVVGVHVGHDGRWGLGDCGVKERIDTRAAGECNGRARVDEVSGMS